MPKCQGGYPELLDKHGFRLVREFSSGGSFARVFLVVDPSGELAVVKYASEPGIDGNGTPWLRAQYRRLREFHELRSGLYPEVRTFFDNGPECYLAMEYLHDARPITEVFMEQGSDDASIDLVLDRVFSEVATIGKTLHRPYEDELHRNFVLRCHHRLTLLSNTTGYVYESVIAPHRFEVGALSYQNAAQFFAELKGAREIDINGTLYPSLERLVLNFNSVAPELQQYLGPTTLSPAGHGDLAMRNVFVRNGQLTLTDPRARTGFESSPEVTSIEFDAAKLAHSVLLEIARCRKYVLNVRRERGELRFEYGFCDDEPTQKLCGLWERFPRLLAQNEALRNLLQGSRWLEFVRLAEALNYVADAVHRMNTDRTGHDALLYYLVATVKLFTWFRTHAARVREL